MLVEEYLQGASITGYQVFGAQFTHEYDQQGVRFTVYAPNAEQIELIGSFNDWTGWTMDRHPNGVWSIFAKNLQPGMLYKYRVHTAYGGVYDRADPFAFFSEKRPDTASILYQLDGYTWNDSAFLSARDKHYTKPMHIYELHVSSWKQTADGNFLSYDELGDQLIPYVKELGCTHIELLPLTEYPFDGSWGYQVSGYFSATSRYGEPKQLMHFVDRCHQAGIGVIMDFVPLHFVTDFYALHQFDGSFLYESEDEALRYSEWGTALFDYTKPHVLSFMKSALNFWLTYYHIDGIRYDAVSRLIYHRGDPGCGVNEAGVWFLKNTNYALGQKWPDVMLIAEDSSMYVKVTAPVAYGGLGFDYKWDLGFMNDTFQYFSGFNRSVNRISASTEYFYQEKYILPFSHDEVVHGKKSILEKLPGDTLEKYAQARLLYLYFFTHPGKKLSFMGNELAMHTEWAENKQLDWTLTQDKLHDSFMQYFKRLSKLYCNEPVLYETDLHPDGFQWIRMDGGVFIYERRSLAGNKIIVALNASGREIGELYIPVQNEGWRISLSTDSIEFGGQEYSEALITKGAIRIKLSKYSGFIFICM